MKRASFSPLFCALFLAALAVSGCDEKNEKPTEKPSASPPPSSAAALAQPMAPPLMLPAPAPWVFRRLSGPPPFALPFGCKARGPALFTEATPSTRFLVEPGALQTLVVGEREEGKSELTHAAAIAFGPDGARLSAKAVPWWSSDDPPHLVLSNGRFFGAFSPKEAAAGTAKVGLVRDGTFELLGEGDGFSAADLACEADRCALLTTRLAKVAAPGAEAWIGNASGPASAWKRVEIPQDPSESPRRPFAIGFSGEASGDVIAAMIETGAMTFWSLQAGAPVKVARLSTPFPVLDVTLSPPLALTLGSEIDEFGCPLGSPDLRIERQEGEPVILKAIAPATGGALRPLGKGFIATWMTPTGCRSARQVVHAVLLGPDGSPTTKPLPIGDASGFAVATSGDDADFWIQNVAGITWLRATCAAEKAP